LIPEQLQAIRHLFFLAVRVAQGRTARIAILPQAGTSALHGHVIVTATEERRK
jgi:hypothetical protein